MIDKHWLSEPPKGKEAKGLFAILGWAAYLGTSWTWVIGMILPALLIRDMGIAGFIIFAIPNCIGAAAMGSVLKGKVARGLPSRHMGMILTFSIITVAYHFYIAGYLLPTLLGPLSLLIFAFSGLCAAGVMMKWRDRGALWFSLAAWVISISCFIIALSIPEASVFEIFSTTPLLDSSYTWFFLPASIGGFLLCPYLDATFIRARARTEKVSGIFAFKIGFLVLFASMIVFTTAYGHELLDSFGGENNRLTGVWAALLLIHIPLQMGLTVAYHCREIYSAFQYGAKDRKQKSTQNDYPQLPNILINNPLTARWTGMVITCTLLFLSVFLLGLLLKNISFESLSAFKHTHEIERIYEDYKLERFISVGEVGYRCLLIFYATLFPAYVMLVMLPTLTATKLLKCPTLPKPWKIFTITVIVSSVTAYFGFVLNQGWAIAATLGIICIGRLFVEWRAWKASKG